MDGMDGGLTAVDVIGVAGRWLMLVGLMLVIGAVTCRLLFALVGKPRNPAPDRVRRTAAWGVAGALMLLAGALVRLVMQVASLGDPSEAGSQVQLLTAVVWATNWGHVWLIHTGLATAAVGAFAVAKRGSRTAWVVAGALALGLAVTPAFAGHAIGVERYRPGVVLSDVLHVLAAGTWLGTLVVLAGVLLRDPAAPGRRAPQESGADIAGLVRAFSPVALTSAAGVGLTGLIAAWVHLDSVASLWRSNYGRALLLKVSLVVLVLAAGAYNWQYATASLTKADGVRKFTRSALVEVSISVLILLATAVLIALPLPGDSGG